MNPAAQRRHKGRLTAGFYIFAAALMGGLLAARKTDDVQHIMLALVLIVVGLVPSYLWVRGKALGFPLFPIFGLSFIWSYAAPLILFHPAVREYSAEIVMESMMISIISFGVGVPLWRRIVSVEKAPPQQTLRFPTDSGIGVVFLCLFMVLGTLFSFAAYGGWFAHGGGLAFASPVFGIARGVSLSAATVAAFVLAYMHGLKALSPSVVFLSVLLICLFIISNVAGLLLIGGANAFALAYAGFTLGRKRLSVLPLVVGIAAFSLLHLGKDEMRAKYGLPGSGATFVQPHEYPVFFHEWVGYAFSGKTIDTNYDREDEPNTILTRASLIQHLMKAVYMTPEMVPFMGGETYRIVPMMIVPRIIWPGKPTSHESTTLLNIHFGNQTREDTLRTTIGWGMFNEAYANFGFPGTVGYCLIMAMFYGFVTRWTMNCSVLSFRFMANIVLTAFILKSEMSASVFVGAVSQAYIALLVLMLLFMRQERSEQPGTEAAPARDASGMAPRAA